MTPLRQPQSYKPRNFLQEPDHGDLLRVQMTYASHNPHPCLFEGCVFKGRTEGERERHVRQDHAHCWPLDFAGRDLLEGL